MAGVRTTLGWTFQSWGPGLSSHLFSVSVLSLVDGSLLDGVGECQAPPSVRFPALSKTSREQYPDPYILPQIVCLFLF